LPDVAFHAEEGRNLLTEWLIEDQALRELAPLYPHNLFGIGPAKTEQAGFEQGIDCEFLNMAAVHR
jgi:hypothetical protein